MEIFILLAFFRFMILFLPFKHLAPFLGEQNHSNMEQELPKEWNWVRAMARYIERMSEIVPWKSECLVQAATGKLLLRRKNIGCTVFLGVKKGKENKELKAHAWLKVGPEIILGGENAHQYVVVSTFS